MTTAGMSGRTRKNRTQMSRRIFQLQMMRMAGNSIDDGYPKRLHHADVESELIHRCIPGRDIATGLTKLNAIGPGIKTTIPADDDFSLIMFHYAPAISRRVSFDEQTDVITNAKSHPIERDCKSELCLVFSVNRSEVTTSKSSCDMPHGAACKTCL